MSQHKDLSKGDVYLQSGRYRKAYDFYKEKLTGRDFDAELVRNAALCARYLGNTDDEKFLYDYLINNSLFPDSLLLEYALILVKENQYDSAEVQVMKYLSVHPGNNRAEKIKASCDSAQKWKNENQNIIVRNVKELNSEYSDFAPARFKDGLVFCSTRETTIIKKKSEKYGSPFSNIYFASADNDRWEVPSQFPSVNTNIHEGPATFNKNFDTIYFSRNGENRKDNHLKLFSAPFVNNKWSLPSEFMLNDSTFSFGHPSISEDGNLFFFTSDIPGGYGGTDIYVCIKADSNWSLPLNLGPIINTEGNEIFPFYTRDGNLYFSSNGHIGIGGFDIFFSSQSEGEWQAPLNLKFPVNSGADDYSFILYTQWPDAFFTSNRKGGMGKDDLYQIKSK